MRAWERDHATPNGRGLTDERFALRYFEHAEGHYRKGGRITSEVHNVRTVLKWLVKLFRGVLVCDLHAGHVATFQSELAASGRYNRRTYNPHVGRLRTAMR